MSEQPAVIFPCPYILGTTFALVISPPHGDPFETKATVTHVYSPFTMSVVMKVTLSPLPVGSNFPSEAILKVYDRRFASGARETYLYNHYKIGPPSFEKEALYAEYLASGDVTQDEDSTLDLLDDTPDGDPYPVELKEHVIALISQEFFVSETTAYERLSSLQGKFIPAFYGTTKFLDDQAISGLDITIPGILLEFVPGTNLDRIDPSTVDLDALCTAAVHIVDAYSDLFVLNNDVRLENFIVKPNTSEVIMIDLGHCRLREEDEDDQAWKQAKSSKDEEGAVGIVGQRHYGWNYVPSGRFDVFVDTKGMKVSRKNPETGEWEDYVYSE